MEVEGEGRVIFADIDEVEYIILMLDKAFDKEGGSEERVGIEVASVHVVVGISLRGSEINRVLVTNDECVWRANEGKWFALWCDDLGRESESK